MRNTLLRIMRFIHPGGHKHVNYVKVLLPGERPWVELLEDRQDRIKGRITNTLWPELSEHEQAQVMNRDFGTVEKLSILHNYKKGDELWFERGMGNREGWWVPIKNAASEPAAKAINLRS